MSDEKKLSDFTAGLFVGVVVAIFLGGLGATIAHDASRNDVDWMDSIGRTHTMVVPSDVVEVDLTTINLNGSRQYGRLWIVGKP